MKTPFDWFHDHTSTVDPDGKQYGWPLEETCESYCARVLLPVVAALMVRSLWLPGLSLWLVLGAWIFLSVVWVWVFDAPAFVRGVIRDFHRGTSPTLRVDR